MRVSSKTKMQNNKNHAIMSLQDLPEPIVQLSKLWRILANPANNTGTCISFQTIVSNDGLFLSVMGDTEYLEKQAHYSRRTYYYTYELSFSGILELILPIKVFNHS